MLRRALKFLLVLDFFAMLAALYAHANPLIFNESFWGHAHCIKIAGLTLSSYAHSHDGRFPYDARGYGNALLLLDEEVYFTLTGPGYSATPFHDAKKSGKQLPEEECGRVYVQGLTIDSNPEIALLFDKLPTPGGDHCHFVARFWAPLGREVWTVGGGSTFVREREWPEFKRNQVERRIQTRGSGKAVRGLSRGETIHAATAHDILT